MNQVQTLRSSVAGTRPTGRPPGELFTNWPDKQLGVIDAANQPLDLVAVRYFSAEANYAIGEFVVEAGEIWRSIVAVVPAPFDPAQWMSLSAVAGDFVTDAELTAALADFLPLAGGTMSGPIVLAADATAPLQAVPLQQLDAYAEWAGGDFTGPITGTDAEFSGVVGSAQFVIDGPAGTYRNLVGTTTGVSRWGIALGDGAPETGTNNAGSDFVITRCTDAGAAIDGVLTLTRDTGAAKFQHDVSIEAATGDAILLLDARVGSSRIIIGKSETFDRWQMTLGNNITQTGGNVGADFALYAYADNGAFLGTVMTAFRSSQVVDFNKPPTVAGVPIALLSELDELRDRLKALEDQIARPKGAR